MNNVSTKGFTRRSLMKSAGATLAAPLLMQSSARGAAATLPASERVNLGFIGVGMMGRGHLRRLVDERAAQITAVCDVDQWRLTDAQSQVDRAYAAGQKSGQYKGCAAYKDFRELLARPDIDAVLIATGDRWHAVHTVMAAKAGKDIYCEKPISLTIHESRAMVDTVRRYGRVFQGGLQQRSTREFRTAVRLIHEGRLGALKVIYANRVGTNDFVNLPEEPVPATLDWDMWVGPAAWHPYNSRYHHLGQPKIVVPWRFNRDFCGGDMTTSAVHNLDIAQWALGMDDSGPVEIKPPGPGETTVTYKYANGVIVQSFQHVLNEKEHYIPEGWDPKFKFDYSLLFVGERGWIYAGRKGILFASSPDLLADVGGNRTQAQTYADIEVPGAVHHRNWLQSIRTRQRPTSDVAISARSTDMAHLGSIAFWTGRTLKWDPIKEEFPGDDQANRMRQRALREPWTL
jgi:predicted dehydrogenase